MGSISAIYVAPSAAKPMEEAHTALVEASNCASRAPTSRKVAGLPVRDPLRHRGGLNCEVLEGGAISVGDTVQTA